MTVDALIRVSALLALPGALLIATPVRGDDQLEIAATVGDDVVYVAELDRELARVLNDRPVEPAAMRILQAKTLQQLVDRRLIVGWLAETKRGATKAEVDLLVSRLEKRLAQRDRTLSEHLAELEMTEKELRRLFEWQAGWQRFLDRYMTDKNLEKYFEQHRRDFDGTRIHIAHILLKIEGDDSQPIIDKAKAIRKEIVAGTMTFEDAAKKHSASPTAAKGGDIGFISRHEPMPESFSKAAFALTGGWPSQPVVTPFGIHLIRRLEVEPGKLRWQDAREELTAAVTQFLFTWAADKRRVQAEIKFSGATPHFKPDTQQLAD